MEFHKISYDINLTGSNLFDITMFDTAKRLCNEFPGLEFEHIGDKIHIYGQLSDYWYEKYNNEMFKNQGKIGR